MNDPIMALILSVVGGNVMDELRRLKEGPTPGRSREDHAEQHREDLEQFKARRESIARALNPAVADHLIAARELVGKICLDGHPPIAVLLGAGIDIAASGDKAAIVTALGRLLEVASVVEQQETEKDEVAEYVGELLERFKAKVARRAGEQSDPRVRQEEEESAGPGEKGPESAPKTDC